MKNSLTQKKRPLVIHPLLFAVLPVLFLYVHNLQFVKPGDLFWPVIVAGLTAGALWLGLGLLVPNRVRRGIIVTLWALSIIIYSRFTAILCVTMRPVMGSIHQARDLSDTMLGPLLWVLLLAAGGWLVACTRRDLIPVNRYFNVLGILLVGSLVFRISVATVKSNISKGRGNMKKETVSTDKPRVTPGEKSPHVFYIILDGYARQDVLQEVYGYDNKPFTEFLKEQGFYVADKAYANYPLTPFSVAASMNYDYLPEITQQGKGSVFGVKTDFELVKDTVIKTTDMIHKGRVITRFRQAGYKVGAFDTKFDPTNLTEADEYLSPGESMTEFQKVLVEMTPFQRLFRKKYYDGHRDRFNFILDNLPDFSRKKNPHFVFAHVVCPHPPFVVDAKGENLYPSRSYSSADASDFYARGGTRDEYLKGYRGQIEYLNRRVRQVIPDIIKNSSRPVVIVIQSDHGPGSSFNWYDYKKSNLKERFGILNAYYFSDGNYQGFYPSISPVNSFRLVINRYLGEKLPMIEDHSVFASWYEQPGKTDYFVDVTSLLPR